MPQVQHSEELDLRRAARHRADYDVIVESKLYGDKKLHISNISANGFMVENNTTFARGDRVELRLPGIGRIEAYMVWGAGERAGFQFERVIRMPDFLSLVDKVRPRRPR